MKDIQNEEKSISHGGEMEESSEKEAIQPKEGKSKSMKTASFRLTDETHAIFKQIAKEIGGNPQETLSKLIDTYLFQASKQEGFMIGRRDEIERVERYSNCILSSFVALIDELGSLEDTVRVQFEQELKLASSNTLKAISERDALQTELESVKKELHNTKTELQAIKFQVKQLEADAKNHDITQALTEALKQLKATPSSTDEEDKK